MVIIVEKVKERMEKDPGKECGIAWFSRLQAPRVICEALGIQILNNGWSIVHGSWRGRISIGISGGFECIRRHH